MKDSKSKNVVTKKVEKNKKEAQKSSKKGEQNEIVIEKTEWINKKDKTKKMVTHNSQEKKSSDLNKKKKSSKKEVAPSSSSKKKEEEVKEEWEDEPETSEELQEDGITFDDVFDDDEEEQDEDFEEEIKDDDDFEIKAEKFRRRMQAQAQLAEAEQRDDATKRRERGTILKDLEAENVKDDVYNEESERVQLLTQHHSAEELRDRIQETVRVLANFKVEREDDRDRAEYLSLLRRDLMDLYEYNDYLMDCIMLLFPPGEVVEFLEAMDKTRPTTIRVNTLKTKRRDLVQALVKRGMNIEPLEKWSKVGLQIFESNVPIAGTVEYLAGYYMLQAAASFLPVMALAPQEKERVLDMSAAPGGKTTYIAQLMKNSGVLFANDVSEPRCKSLNANIQRLGVTNCVVTNYDGVGYEKVMRNFDRVLLDAPCTGTGIISRDKTIKTSKYYEDVQRITQQQRTLLLSAIDSCKVGGCVVYSTCSFLVEEDEAVVAYALTKRDVEVVDMGLPFGRPGFTKYRHYRYPEALTHSRRYFPHVHNMDGFYVCKLKKISTKIISGSLKEEASTSPHFKRERGPSADSGGTEKKKEKRETSEKQELSLPKNRNKISIPPPNTKRKQTKKE